MFEKRLWEGYWYKRRNDWKILEYGEIKEITTVVPRLIPLKNRTKELEKIWKEFSEGSITITDRLHGMLFSVLNQTPCIVLNNKTGKVFGVLEWIKALIWY